MANKEQVQQWLDSDFIPESGVADPGYRIASALEYLAYHAGCIDKSLTLIAGAIEPGEDVQGPGIRQSLAESKSLLAQVAHVLAKPGR